MISSLTEVSMFVQSQRVFTREESFKDTLSLDDTAVMCNDIPHMRFPDKFPSIMRQLAINSNERRTYQLCDSSTFSQEIIAELLDSIFDRFQCIVGQS